MADLGTAYVQIVPSAKGISGSISNVLNGEADTAGTSAGNTIASKIKGALKGAAIGAAVVKAFNIGAELEQNLGGTEAVFGKYANTVQTQATQAYKKMGVSASEYMATANKMGSLFQGSGLTQQKSLELTTAAMQRATDVASVMGIDTAMAMESIAGAAKGNFTMMDNLGVAMNATAIEAYALEKGINFNWNTASQAEKAEIAMQMFMERTAQYAGNAQREATETLAGSFGMIKSSFFDFVGALVTGGDITTTLSNLVNSFTTGLLPQLITAITNIATALPGIIIQLIGTGIPTIINTLSTQLSTSLSGIAPGTISTFFSSMLGQLGTGVAQLVGAIASGLLQLVPKLPGIASEIGNGFITGLVKFVVEGVKGLVEKIKGMFKFNVSLPKIKLPHFSISPRGWSLGDLLKGSIPRLNVSWYAKGGIVDGATLVGAGEAGAEAIVPLDPFWQRLDNMADSIVNGVALALAGASQGGNITIPVYLYPNGQKMDEIIVKSYDRGKRALYGTV